MARNARQMKILELISDSPIETQEDLAARLMEAGFSVPKATISRDIKELGLVKINDKGRQRYAKENGGNKHLSSNMANIYRNAVLSITSAQNLVVLKTVPGGASSVGMNIDRLEDPGILGCVAGDDTLLVIAATVESANEIAGRLRELL